MKLSKIFSLVNSAYKRNERYFTFNCPTKKALPVLQLLTQKGFIKNFSKTGNIIKVHLQYSRNFTAIQDIKVISTKVTYYKKAKVNRREKLNPIKSSIATTPKGVICNLKSKKLQVGGKTLAEFY